MTEFDKRKSEKKLLGFVKEDFENKGIVEIYDTIARKMGFDPGTIRYDCSKISVSDDIREAFFKYCESQFGGDPPASGAAAAWVSVGPKTDKNLPEASVLVFDGFFVAS
jgi:hypothetical protein